MTTAVMIDASAALHLGPILASARTARVSVRAQLLLWGLPALADDVEAVTSELVANAVAASAVESTPIVLRLVLTTGSVFVECYDSAPGLPVATAAGDGAESGRGLAMVAALSADWGWCPAEGRSRSRRRATSPGGVNLDSGGGPVRACHLDGPLTISSEDGMITVSDVTAPGVNLNSGGGRSRPPRSPDR